MKNDSRAHLSNRGLLSGVTNRLAVDSHNTADLLPDLAELDQRKLFVPAGYPSMYKYGVHELPQVRRADAGAGDPGSRRDARIDRAIRGPIARAERTESHGATGPGASCPIGLDGAGVDHGASSGVSQAHAVVTRPDRDAVHDARVRLRCAGKGRCIPAEIKREVWMRDGGRRTFVGERGKRFGSRDRVEFEHIVPIARGGETSASNLRLLCRAHNQYTAECALGHQFMRGKRERAKERRRMRPAAGKPNIALHQAASPGVAFSVAPAA
jgi:hypothetical protein